MEKNLKGYLEMNLGFLAKYNDEWVINIKELKVKGWDMDSFGEIKLEKQEKLDTTPRIPAIITNVPSKAFICYYSN